MRISVAAPAVRFRHAAPLVTLVLVTGQPYGPASGSLRPPPRWVQCHEEACPYRGPSKHRPVRVPVIVCPWNVSGTASTPSASQGADHSRIENRSKLLSRGLAYDGVLMISSWRWSCQDTWDIQR